MFDFLLGKQLRVHLIDTEFVRDVSGDPLVIAGQHHDRFDAARPDLFDHGRRVRSDRIGKCDPSENGERIARFAHDENARLAVHLQIANGVESDVEAVNRVAIENGLEVAWVPDMDRSVPDPRVDAFADDRFETARSGNVECSLGGGFNGSFGQMVLGP